MDELIGEINAEMPDPAPEVQIIDMDIQVPPPVRLPTDEPWVEIVNGAKDEFEVDGALSVFSTWRVEDTRADRMDDTTTDERAAHLIRVLPQGEYILKLKYLRERRLLEPDEEGRVVDCVAEDKFDPVKAERRKGRGVITIDHDTKLGALIGIDRPYYHNAYTVTAVVYGLYPIRDPDPANLAPLRDGDLNCVAHIVVEHFEGALRGQGLTPIRRQKIQEWENRVHELGATVGDVTKLEKILKRSISLKDIPGEDIYKSGTYGHGGYRPNKLICHNDHAWSKDLHFPQVHLYQGDVWEAIRDATQDQPIAVWLLGGEDRQLSVDQFVLQDGRTYRTRERHDKLIKACAELGNPELAEKVFGVNHAAAVTAREKNGWKPTSVPFADNIHKACVEHGHGGLWNSMGYDTREVVSIDMKACYPASFQGMGEAQPYLERFGHPNHRMIRVAINDTLPKNIGTGFAEVIG